MRQTKTNLRCQTHRHQPFGGLNCSRADPWGCTTTSGRTPADPPRHFVINSQSDGCCRNNQQDQPAGSNRSQVPPLEYLSRSSVFVVNQLFTRLMSVVSGAFHEGEIMCAPGIVGTLASHDGCTRGRRRRRAPRRKSTAAAATWGPTPAATCRRIPWAARAVQRRPRKWRRPPGGAAASPPGSQRRSRRTRRSSR